MKINPNFSWNNRTNANYYERANLSQFVEDAGLASCPELSVVQSYLWEAKKLLEVGANYGRVLDYLLAQGFKGEIDAIERSEHCCNILKQKYHDVVTIFHADLMGFFPQEKYDAVLWLWSGISDFSREEQLLVIKHLAGLLNSQGTLIIETTCHERPMANNGSAENQQEYNIFDEEVVICGYRPSPEEVIQMGGEADLKLVKFTEYYTTTQVPRRLFVFQRDADATLKKR